MAEKPKVYFTKVITPKKIIEMYNKLNYKEILLLKFIQVKKETKIL